MARHRMPFCSTNEGYNGARVDDVAGIGPGAHCSPRHRMPCNTISEGLNRVSMTWQAASARPHVEGGAEMSNRAKFRALPVDNQIMRRITDGQLCATPSQAGREARKLRNHEVGPAGWRSKNV